MQNLYRILRVSTLKGRLRLWVGVLIVTMCVLIVLFMSLLGKVIKERETHSALREAIELQRMFIDKWKSERLADIEYLAAMPGARALNLEEMRSQFRMFKLTHTEFDTISFINAAGNTSLNLDGPFDTNVSDRDYFRAVRDLRKPYVTDVMIGRVTGKYIVGFVAPVIGGDGKFAGAIIGAVELTTLDSIMNQFRFGANGETFLLDRDGFRITKPRDRFDAPRITVQYQTDIYQRAVAGLDAPKSYLNQAGERVYGAYAWTSDRQWLLVGETRTADVYKPYFNLFGVMALITALILIASYIAAMLLTRKMIALLRHLLNGTKRIREGRFGYQIDPSIIRTAPAELKELSDNFNIMSAKLATTMQLLEESAVIDHLTEVYNRRFLMNEGTKIEEAAARAGNPSSILLIDVDYFKQINDTYGHLVGDRVLKHAASLLVACVRHSDVVSRYGGEEFVVLATNCELERGCELAERIRTWFISSPYRDEEREIAITVSIGVAQSRPERTYGTNRLEDMIERADKALYRAKNRGRNRVECDDPEPRRAE
ncbi:diguanylate cyclase [Paenibacillus flagellatus]|uniref:Diguanylate cyclase n=1 Tax=Paenibacillus flagellatus TaxID=2211139 RepID=A0A2V5KRQ8_9BACL|nr:diguanylate cyclase [Paenibacillus flagellatus]PYI51596.1 hypothetical protein DLM86_24615 [Paenibacillus flagellatus]